MDGSLMGLPLGGRDETGTTTIGMSPLKPGMGEIKISKVCIHTNKV
jgi:hypothetical protein